MNHSERALENHAEVLPRRSAQYFGTKPNERAERKALKILKIATMPVATKCRPTTF
jgi:hypothetical protein